MKYETTWKPRVPGGTSAEGRRLEPRRLRSRRDIPIIEDHAPKRLPMATRVSAQWCGWAGCRAGARQAAEVERPPKTGAGRLFAQGSRNLWLRHRPLDVPTNPSTDRAEVWSPLPCRCHPARDGVVRFFPLRSPNAARWNATRRPSPGGSKRTGHGSSEWPGVVRPTWFSSMKRAFCCPPWFAEPGRLADRPRSCDSERDITAASRPSAGCRSRRNAADWAGISTSTWTGLSGKNRLSISCATCWGTWMARSSWPGIAWPPTAVRCCGCGCDDADESTWNPCPDTPRSSIPTNTGGRISRAIRWPITARMRRNNCMPASCSLVARLPVSKLCSVRLSMQPTCLYGFHYEYYFYRAQ